MFRGHGIAQANEIARQCYFRHTADEEILCSLGDRLHEDAITVAIARGAMSRDRASALINKRYAWRNYGTEHRVPEDPCCTTFVASHDENVSGTLTLRVDSHLGLAADKTFGDMFRSFREKPGASICELTKLACSTSKTAKPRLAALFHTVLIYGSVYHDCTDLFIEVISRHRSFYEVLLGFRAIAEPRMNLSVGAPTHLLWLNVDAIRENIARHRGTLGTAGRSLYPYFLSPEDEEHVVQTLTEMRAANELLAHHLRKISTRQAAAKDLASTDDVLLAA